MENRIHNKKVLLKNNLAALRRRSDATVREFHKTHNIFAKYQVIKEFLGYIVEEFNRHYEAAKIKKEAASKKFNDAHDAYLKEKWRLKEEKGKQKKK